MTNKLGNFTPHTFMIPDHIMNLIDSRFDVKATVKLTQADVLLIMRSNFVIAAIIEQLKSLNLLNLEDTTEELKRRSRDLITSSLELNSANK